MIWSGATVRPRDDASAARRARSRAHDACGMIRLRHADEWVGLLVVAAVAGIPRRQPAGGCAARLVPAMSDLRHVLPETGVAGLSVGADVEVLGTHAGVIRRVVISPNQQMYAEAEIDDQARAFIRRDSQGTIRRRYGVAGAAYVDVSRGKGAELDWNYAVIQAVTERDPTESIGALIDQARQKIFPILDDAGRSTKALADVMEHMQKGEGDVGRLLTDETMVRDVEAIVAKASGIVRTLDSSCRSFNWRRARQELAKA